jgi:catechol 2,3-dioxygenase-like lactoylglutathione lyase family enzyme
MIDHLNFAVRDVDRSVQFYARVLAPLGYELLIHLPPHIATDGRTHYGFGRDHKPMFWIGSGEPVSGRLHFAFAAATRSAVDAFHAAALQAGAADNGAPGLRPHYHPHYYAAFAIDLDGHNIEAVCHHPAE